MDIPAVPTTPRAWRDGAGLTRAEVARRAGVGGKNPSATYGRYESGESPCPAEVVEAVREMSGGVVGAESWHAVRLAWLAAQPAQPAQPAQLCAPARSDHPD